MIIDCHYHIETRIQPLENLLKKMDQSGIAKTALMATMWDPPPETAEGVLKLLRFLLYHRTLRWLAKKVSANFSPEGNIVLPKQTVKLYRDREGLKSSSPMQQTGKKFSAKILKN